MEFLQIGEWTRWRDDDREFKATVLQALGELKKDSTEQAVEIRFIRNRQKMVSAGISTVVSAIVGAIVSSFR